VGDYVYGLLGSHACDGVYHGGAVVGYVVKYVLGYVLPGGPWEVVEVELVGGLRLRAWRLRGTGRGPRLWRSRGSCRRRGWRGGWLWRFCLSRGPVDESHPASGDVGDLKHGLSEGAA